MNFDVENDFYFVSQSPITDVTKFEIIDSNGDEILSTTTGFTQLNNYNYKYTSIYHQERDLLQNFQCNNLPFLLINYF